jgi:hypothetical protein
MPLKAQRGNRGLIILNFEARWGGQSQATGLLPLGKYSTTHSRKCLVGRTQGKYDGYREYKVSCPHRSSNAGPSCYMDGVNQAAPLLKCTKMKIMQYSV